MFVLRPEDVVWVRAELRVTRVMTRYGIREWPKTRKSNRLVPVPEHLMPQLAALAKRSGRNGCSPPRTAGRSTTPITAR